MRAAKYAKYGRSIMQEIGIRKRQKPLQRIAVVALGSVLVLGGTIALLLPVVPGSLLIVAGVLMLSPQCPWLRRALQKCRVRFPILERAFRRLSSWGKSCRSRFRNSNPGSSRSQPEFEWLAVPVAGSRLEAKDGTRNRIQRSEHRMAQR